MQLPAATVLAAGTEPFAPAPLRPQPVTVKSPVLLPLFETEKLAARKRSLVSVKLRVREAPMLVLRKKSEASEIWPSRSRRR